MKTATMTVEDIKKAKSDGYKLGVYGDKFGFGYICEISFTKKTSSGFAGFSFDHGCGLRQRELRSLFNRVKKVYPKAKIEA